MSNYFFFARACDLLSCGLPITRLGWDTNEFMELHEGILQRYVNEEYTPYVITKDDLVSVVWSQFHKNRGT